MLAVLVGSSVVAVLVYIVLGDSYTEPVGGAQDAYILENQITHARLLPTPSTHAFTYPTLAFFLPLDALERHKLDLARGWLFGYGGTSWRVTGLRSAAYLSADVGAGEVMTIKKKLQSLLRQYGHDAGRLGEVWMMTMPSYMGYEGINPLTVHYCYEKTEEGKWDENEDNRAGRLAWVVLEIHNTFGEKHVHVLESGVGEDEDRPAGFDHQWTFAREFHVSPFNDRLGHYRVSVSAPPAPSSSALSFSSPRPKIRIHLHAPSPADASSDSEQDAVGPLKLTATLVARRAAPLTSLNLVHSLTRYPLALFLSFARILYHAWILHYVKRLDVFPRPDPKPAMRAWADLDLDAPPHKPSEREHAPGAPRAYGGVGWQEEGMLEGYSRRVVERFLRRRASELGITVALVSGDPSVPTQVFNTNPSKSLQSDTAGSDCKLSKDALVIHYTAPRFFSTLMLAPSVAHMLLLGRVEELFRVNSELVFMRAFAVPVAPSPSRMWARWGQSVRKSLLPQRFLQSAPLDDARHPLDDDEGLMNIPVICLLHTADVLEKRIFTVAKARFVPGLEPWGRWERAAKAV